MNKTKHITMRTQSFKKIVIVLILIGFSCQKTFSQSIKTEMGLYEKLKSLPGVYVKKIETLKGFNESYELAIVQPIDHKNPSGPKFTQKVFLSHIDFNKPVVFETHGYDVPWHKNRELSSLLNANQIIVEHRYYGGSKPNPLEWKHLTTWQAAADHHRIIELIKTIYKGKWISTGKSKGGMAALFLEYYYPDDIEATIAFVAPIILGLEDHRFQYFINQIGNNSQRQKINKFQINCLENRESILVHLKNYLVDQRIKYSISLDSILEWSVLEFPYVFWFGNNNVNVIPDSNSSSQTIFNYLNKISPISSFGEKWIQYNYPLVFQELTEIGYYSYDLNHLDGLLTKVEKPDISIFLPPNVKIPAFDPEVMRDIHGFLQTKANNIIYLYGEFDMYTAGSVNPETTTNSLQIIIKGFGHKFKLSDIDKNNKNKIINTLKEWIHE